MTKLKREMWQKKNPLFTSAMQIVVQIAYINQEDTFLWLEEMDAWKILQESNYKFQSKVIVGRILRWSKESVSIHAKGTVLRGGGTLGRTPDVFETRKQKSASKRHLPLQACALGKPINNKSSALRTMYFIYFSVK